LFIYFTDSGELVRDVLIFRDGFQFIF